MTTTAKNETYLDHIYAPLWKDIPQRYILLTGGRGPGKSYAVATWACYSLYQHQNWRILFTRYTLTSAEISIIPEFENKLDLLHIRRYFDVKRKAIRCPARDSDILFSGIKTSSGNQTAKLKSIPGLNIFIVDEAEEFEDEKAFDTIDFSIRAVGIPNRIILIMNPTTTSHWIWEKWFEGHTRYEIIDGARVAMCTHPDVLHIHTTYLDNTTNLSEQFLHEVVKLREINKDKYDHVIIGAWRERAEGVIYANWREGPFDQSLPYCYGLDDGYTDPFSLIKVAVDNTRRKVYAREILYKTGLSTNQVINLMGIVERPNDLIVADSENPRLIEDLAISGFNTQGVYKYPGSVIDGIRRIQDYEIIVSPDSQNLKKELNNYIWNDKKAEVPVDDYNHLLDALRYAFGRLSVGSDVLASS